MKITLEHTAISQTALRAVRADFNIAGLSSVDRIKLMGAALIYECEKIKSSAEGEPDQIKEAIRAASVAITEVETAVMWAVKAATADLP